ncbi:hypothetical protein B6Q75_25670, partial [Escherichia coli]|nr:hypothetical protein [Escherichia coli]
LYLFFICCDRVFLNVTGIMFQFFITPQEVLPDNRTTLSDCNLAFYSGLIDGQFWALTKITS